MRSGFSLSSLLQEGSARLAATSLSPRLDAEVLLSHLLGCSRLSLYIDGETVVEQPIAERFSELIIRRCRHEPVAYLTGTKEFWGLDFEVSPAVLVPRPDTEILVEEAVLLLSLFERRASIADPYRVLDLGTGSGCIAIAVAHECRERGIPVRVFGVDSSCEALKIARRNAERHTIDMIFFAMSWVSALRGAASFDLILSNPPYIDQGDTCRSPETEYEPPQALFSENAGLADIRELLSVCPALVREEGTILCEVGRHQAEIIKSNFVPRGFALRTIHDLGGVERVIALARMRTEGSESLK